MLDSLKSELVFYRSTFLNRLAGVCLFTGKYHIIKGEYYLELFSFKSRQFFLAPEMCVQYLKDFVKQI